MSQAMPADLDARFARPRRPFFGVEEPRENADRATPKLVLVPLLAADLRGRMEHGDFAPAGTGGRA